MGEHGVWRVEGAQTFQCSDGGEDHGKPSGFVACQRLGGGEPYSIGHLSRVGRRLGLRGDDGCEEPGVVTPGLRFGRDPVRDVLDRRTVESSAQAVEDLAEIDVAGHELVSKGPKT